MKYNCLHQEELGKMAMTTCKECKKEISTAADACPHCGAKKQKFFSTGGCIGLGCLGLLALALIIFAIGYRPDPAPTRIATDPPASVVDTPAPSVDQLELLALRWSKSSESHVTAEGQIKNVSGESLKNVQAVVTFHDKSEGFVTTDTALIDYNPILPGQTSPFSVIATYNPEMHSISVEFKQLMGGTLSLRDGRKKK